MSPRRRLITRLLLAAAGLSLLAGCQKKLEPAQFVGTWKSSRLSTPLVMRANGDWEIRAEDDAVLQYGVWQLDGQRLMWTVRQANGAVTHDVNPIVAVEPRRFVLRERDGSETRFDRLD